MSDSWYVFTFTWTVELTDNDKGLANHSGLVKAEK